MSGTLFVVSAPSGAGKTTLIRQAMEQMTGLHFSVSHTTRPIRGGEQEGVDYFFRSHEAFEAMIREDRFLEWARVHDNLYGTSREWVYGWLDRNEDVILDIDVQGAEHVKQRVPDSVQILIFPPSYAALKERLVRRGLDRPETIERRLAIAREELSRFPMYDYVIINEDLKTAVENLKSILRARRLAVSRSEGRVAEILSTFPSEHA
jgi:guanylate kinase